MRFLVKHTPKDEVLLTSPKEMQGIIIEHLEYLAGLEDEGRIVDSGAFAGLRGGFLVVEAGSTEELDTILSLVPGMSFMNTEVYPLIDLHTRIEQMKKRKKKTAEWVKA